MHAETGIRLRPAKHVCAHTQHMRVALPPALTINTHALSWSPLPTVLVRLPSAEDDMRTCPVAVLEPWYHKCATAADDPTLAEDSTVEGSTSHTITGDER